MSRHKTDHRPSKRVSPPFNRAQQRRTLGMSRVQSIGMGLFLAGLFILALSAASMLYGGDDKNGLPNLGTAPEWSLTDRNGNAFTSEQAEGKPYIALFYFLQCRGVCPAMLGTMKQLDATIAQSDLKDKARIIGMSIDGERDTPESLNSYFNTTALTNGITQLLTGPQETVWQIANAGFKLAVERNTAPNLTAGLEINHTGRFVLVDKQGRIRGYYDNEDPAQLQQLLEDLNSLAKQ